MTAAEWAGIIAAIGTPIAGLAAFLKWYLAFNDQKVAAEYARQEKRRLEEIERQDELREALRDEMQKRITELMQTVRLQGALVNGLMNHIRLLEQEMARAGLEIPKYDIEGLTERFSQ